MDEIESPADRWGQGRLSPHLGPNRKGAIRPTPTSTLAICYVRLTSIRDVASAQIAVVRRAPGEGKSVVSANLAIANLDFADFADGIDESGTYRG